MSEQEGHESEPAGAESAPTQSSPTQSSPTPGARPTAAPAVRRRRAPRRPRATLGGIIGTSFRIWARNVVPFVALTALMLSPSLALQVWIALEAPDPEYLLPWTAGLGILQWMLSTVVTGALIFGVFQELRGQQASMGDILARGLARLPAVLFVGILVGLCTMICAGLGALIGGMTTFILGPLAIVPMIAGMAAGGLPIYSGLYVAVPAVVLERPGLFGAMSRSWTLTQGYKLTLSALIVLYLVAGIALGLVVFALSTLALGVASTLIELAVSVVTTSITAVFAGVAYHDIRVSKEGIGTDELAAIFD